MVQGDAHINLVKLPHKEGPQAARLTTIEVHQLRGSGDVPGLAVGGGGGQSDRFQEILPIRDVGYLPL